MLAVLSSLLPSSLFGTAILLFLVLVVAISLLVFLLRRITDAQMTRIAEYQRERQRLRKAAREAKRRRESAGDGFL